MRMSDPTRRVAIAAGLAAMVVAVAVPAVAADGKPLARYVPRDDLVVYSEFGGLDAHAAAWRQTAAYKMLNETTAGAMLSTVLSQVIDGALAALPEGDRPTGKQVVASAERLARSGFVLGINGKIGPTPPRAVFALRDAGGKEVGPWVRKLLATLTRAGGKSEAVTREDGRKVTFIRPVEPVQGGPPPWAWWFEGDDLLVAVPGSEADVDAILGTIAGGRPSAVDAPSLAELARPADGFDPVFVSFADLANLPPLPPSLGLAGLKRLDSRWGFQGPALVSVTRIVAPSPRTGILGLFDQPTFSPTAGLPVPEGLNDFSMVSVDPARLFDQFVAIAEATDPNAKGTIQGARDQAKGMLGVDVRDELLAQVGPRMAFYFDPQATTVPVNPYLGVVEWALHPPRYTAVLQVRDVDRLAKTLDTLMDVANRQIKAQMANVPEGGLVEFRKVKEGRGYVLHVPLGTFPLPSGVRPAILLGKGHLAMAISPGAARKALAFESRVATPPATAGPLAGLPANLTMLNVNDPSAFSADVIANLPFFVQAFGMLAANGPNGPGPVGPIRLDLDPDALPEAAALRKYLFPGTVTVAVDDRGVEVRSRDAIPSLNPIAAGPVAAALLLPAVQSARTAARRVQSVNNLKQIGLAMHNFHSVGDTFPAANLADAEGKPLLSWRVAILPYIEQDALYKEFHLDERWDSPHNKTLIDRMPAIYKSPMNPPKDPNTTYYQVFTGGGALFDPATKGPGLRDVTDGTSNTILAVEAGTAVSWTKPEDVPFDPEKDVPKLGGPGFPGGFNALFGDGSVRFIKNSVKPEILKAIITRAGGEVVSSADF